MKLKKLVDVKKLQQIIAWETLLPPFNEEQEEVLGIPTNNIGCFVWATTKEGRDYWLEVNAIFNSFKEKKIDALWDEIREKRFNKMLSIAEEK